MRTIDVFVIQQKVEELFIKAAYCLPQDIEDAINKAYKNETSKLSGNILNIIIKNHKKAREMEYPLCQDTGMAIVFLEIGQNVHFTGGFICDAINKGVANAYTKGYLRNSIVGDPFDRKNTNNNTPAIIYTEIVMGDQVKIFVLPKGFGAENQSQIKMMMPSDKKDAVIDFIVKGVISSGGKGCPPCVIGIGIGGTFEYSAYLSKKALLIPLDKTNPNPFYAKMEDEIIKKINQSNIGPMGIGGKTTALGVKILTSATHIAGLPVAYNYCCHSCRHQSITI